MIFDYRYSTGFSLLEMLIVITISALFMGLVITLPLQYVQHSERESDIPSRFNKWLEWQKSNAIFSSAPLRMCIDEHQIEMQSFAEGKWQPVNAIFTVPSFIKIRTVYRQEDSNDESPLPCFIISANGISPAGGIVFGSQPIIQWNLNPLLFPLR